jgi:UDP-glucose 4-epimerase
MKSSGGKRFAIIGAGFIGQALVRNFLKQGIEVSVLDRHVCPDEFVDKVSWVAGDFQDQHALSVALQGVTVAYHLVSSTVPGDQHVDVAKELQENVVGSLHFIDSCLAAGVNRIVFASSSSVYGVQEHFPISESASTNPVSAHGIHKLTLEKFLLLANHLHGIEVRILRIANPYGPGQSILGRQGFVAIAIGSLLQNVPLALRDMGRMVRDFIYIDDLAEALARAGQFDGLSPIMNIGAGKGYTLREVLDVMGQLVGREVRTISADARSVDIPVSVMNIGLAHARMGFTPTIGLREGLAKTLRSHGFQLNEPLNDKDAI